MTWFRLDDQGAFHAKVIKAGNEAYGAWCRAGQWSSAHLTDGVVPIETALLVAPGEIWQRLIDVGLCEKIDASAIKIHDFLDYNPSAKTIKRERAANAKRLAKWRDAKRNTRTRSNTVTNAVTNGVGNGVSNGAPVPSRPDPDPDPVQIQIPAGGGGGSGAPPPAQACPPGQDPDIAALASAIRAEPKFQSLDADDIAERALPVSNRKPLSWLTKAASDAALHTPRGELAHVTHKRLASYLAHAKAPRGPDGPVKTQERVTVVSVESIGRTRPADHALPSELRDLVGNLGKGPGK